MNLEKYFFTSDQHFGHANIIKFCNRPYDTVQEMDDELIANWNDTVPEDGVVYHLGDFCLGNFEQSKKYFSSLNGKILVLGLDWHHDKRWLKTTRKFYQETATGQMVEILPPEHVLEIDLGERYPFSLHLSHYPIGDWDKKFHGGLHLHGHSHGQYDRDYHKSGELCFDVGVDGHSMNFAPISLSYFIGKGYEEN